MQAQVSRPQNAELSLNEPSKDELNLEGLSRDEIAIVRREIDLIRRDKDAYYFNHLHVDMQAGSHEELRARHRAIMLELASELVRICEAYSLTYFAIGGTALGALRHKGYIPWDDDIDFALPRSDYERLRAIARHELAPRYCLRAHESDTKYIWPFMKLEDTTTTLIGAEHEDKAGYFTGVYVDVFPYDEFLYDPEVFKETAAKIPAINSGGGAER